MSGSRPTAGEVRAARGLIEALEASFADALRVPEGTAPPAAILWADPDRQWLPLMPRLRAVMPQLYTLGEYAPAARTGPSIWLRCVIERVLADARPPEGVTPILYLPGVSRQELRAGAECPAALQPLVELQYRGRVWHQRSGREWTVEAFLVSEEGLGLEVAEDARTREALLRALPFLAETPVAALAGRRLDGDDFDRLAVCDPTRDLLRWMDAGDAAFSGDAASRRPSFANLCRAEFGFDPDRRAPRDAAAMLVDGAGKWRDVWDRFREAPKLYPGVPRLLREIPGQLTLGFAPERVPRLNEEAEARLRKELERAASLPQAKACEKVLALEAEHGPRRAWVWAELGESPLAVAVAPLARLAVHCRTAVGGATVEATADAYATEGWKCDRAALETVASVRSAADTAVVHAVVRALYEPWLDGSARHFQRLLVDADAAGRRVARPTSIEQNVCLLFVDALRFDLAFALRERLEAQGLRVRVSHRLSPLPSVTATAKPFAAGMQEELAGGPTAEGFVPHVRATGQPATAAVLRAELSKAGVDAIADETRAQKPEATSGWAEMGHLDEIGHRVGAGLAREIGSELERIAERVRELLECGWARIQVVTDHGWLLLPGGLPRVELPSHLAATRWARCASVRGESTPAMPTFAWHWNPQARIASPPGIACFFKGEEYAHGGVSLQECVVPELVVERGVSAATAKIAGVEWRRMRCRVSVASTEPTLRIDLRLHPKQPSTSIAAAVKEIGPSGEASLAVADDSHEGAAAIVVLLDSAGNVLDRMPTTVGGVP